MGAASFLRVLIIDKESTKPKSTSKSKQQSPKQPASKNLVLNSRNIREPKQLQKKQIADPKGGGPKGLGSAILSCFFFCCLEFFLHFRLKPQKTSRKPKTTKKRNKQNQKTQIADPNGGGPKGLGSAILFFVGFSRGFLRFQPKVQKTSRKPKTQTTKTTPPGAISK